MQTSQFFHDVYNSQEVLPCNLPFIKKPAMYIAGLINYDQSGYYFFKRYFTTASAACRPNNAGIQLLVPKNDFL